MSATNTRKPRKTHAQRVAEYATRRREAGYRHVRFLLSPEEYSMAQQLADYSGQSVPGVFKELLISHAEKQTKRKG